MAGDWEGRERPQGGGGKVGQDSQSLWPLGPFPGPLTGREEAANLWAWLEAESNRKLGFGVVGAGAAKLLGGGGLI